MRKAWAGVLAMTLAGVAAPASAVRLTPNYTSITVFGDSLVDAGNVFARTNGANPPAAVGYFQGRYTNGYDYTDLISLALFGAPTTASLTGGSNYAYGGARILNSGAAVPNLSSQVASYQARLGNGQVAVDPNGLYVLNFGGNDQFNAAAAANALYGGDQKALIRDAAAQYADAVQSLNDLGARNILVTGFPVGDELAATGNNALIAELAGLQLAGNTTLYRFDYLDFFARLRANPTAFGVAPFTTTATCRSGGAAALANDCAGYSSFDGVHPIASVQRAIYLDLNSQFQLVNPVPEPATWGLMILGFALVGAAVRRPRVRVRYRVA